MEKRNAAIWFQVLAICSALGFGGTYVWRQQQKVALQIDKTDERMVLSGSKSTVIAPVPLPVDQGEIDRVLMPSSKVGIFKPEPEKKEERILMPGSKSAIVIPQDRILLPSSKSITMPVFRERHPAPAEPPKPAEP